MSMANFANEKLKKELEEEKIKGERLEKTVKNLEKVNQSLFAENEKYKSQLMSKNFQILNLVKFSFGRDVEQ
jgi:hypothetical protein